MVYIELKIQRKQLKKKANYGIKLQNTINIIMKLPFNKQNIKKKRNNTYNIMCPFNEYNDGGFNDTKLHII